MEQEMISNEQMSAAANLVDRLNAAAAMLEQGLERMDARYSEMTGNVQQIVATVDGQEHTLERRLHEVELQLAELRAQAGRGVSQSTVVAGRKTLPSSTAALLAKQGISASDSVDSGALDAALKGLSIEQRIAVKSQLLRAGLIG
jgi:hypothetical protein